MTDCWLVVYTGKGGVGKTTISAATAIATGALGQRTLITSTDPAHSLGDSFGVDLGAEPVEVSPGCFAQEVHGRTRMEAGWVDIQGYLAELMRWGGANRIEAAELAVLPGIEEVLALADIYDMATSGDWDTIVLDCAPTAETVRLLSLPEVLAWYMERAFPMSRRLTKLVRPVVSRLTELPVADDRVFEAVERLYDQLLAVRQLLSDQERSAIRIVMTPERMVVAEARRTFTYLSLFGYHVDAVVLNRILPASVSDPFFERWRHEQEQTLTIVDESFGGTPVLRVETADREITGTEPLVTLSGAIFGSGDPASAMSKARTLGIEQDGDAAVVVIALPFADRAELEIAMSDGELIVTYGPYRRCIALPDSLRSAHVVSARLADDELRVELAHS